MSRAILRPRRGAPLATIAVLLCLWVAARAVLWENPAMVHALENADGYLPAARSYAQTDRSPSDVPPRPAPMGEVLADKSRSDNNPDSPAPRLAVATVPNRESTEAAKPRDRGFFTTNQARDLRRALEQRAAPNARRDEVATTARRAADTPSPRPPFAAPMTGTTATEPDSLSLDAWVFVREGSRSAPIAQTRVPIYGASQAGARLQYAIDAGSPHPAHGFVRVYQALVPGGETELAAGLSARPVGAIPIRAVAEIRGVEDTIGLDLRPAAYVFTEIPPVALPADLTLEAYGGAGYVGGRAGTAFIDGQVVALRDIARIDGSAIGPVRIGAGAGAWGGAQQDAGRLDIGPSIRADFEIAQKPLRVTVDYRHRAAGDAAPDSGVTVTLSTRF